MVSIKRRLGLLMFFVAIFTVLSFVTSTCFAAGTSSAAVALGSPADNAPAAQTLPSRTISVSGSADVMVIPDEAVFSLAVETTNMDVSKAKAENDSSIKKIKAIANELKIDSKYVATDFINVFPKYSYTNNGDSVLKGYTVHRGLVITLKDLSKFEELLTRLLDAGANYIQNVQFKTSELRKYKDEARAQAVKAAKEKASAMAKELGQTIGKANMIQEVQEDIYSYYPPWSSSYSGTNFIGNSLSNSISNAQGAGGQNINYEDFSPGQIKVSARVAVTFELN